MTAIRSKKFKLVPTYNLNPTVKREKMAPALPTCSKCKKKMLNREFLHCKTCNNDYHLDCESVSYKLFRLMKNKSNWRCRKCLNGTQKKVHSSTPKQISPSYSKEAHFVSELKKPASSLNTTGNEVKSQITPVDHEDYVTQRRKKSSSNNITFSTVDSSGSSLSETNISNPCKSLPDMSTLQNTELESLKREIYDLKIALQSTENEMENIIIEKNGLERKISEQDRKIQYLLHICANPKNNAATTKSARKQKRRYANKLDKTKDEYNLSPRTPGIPTDNINEELTPINQINTDSDENISHKMSEENSIMRRKYENNTRKRKRIYILADEQGQGLREALLSQVDQEYNIFSFWKRGADLVQIINTCKSDVAQLTKQDYLIIAGGMNSTNPFYLKTKLLEWLNTMNNTNIIICGLPKNAYLNNTSLNFEMKLICQGFPHCSFVNMYYKTSKYASKFFIQNLCFALTRELCHLSHRRCQGYDLLVPPCNSTQTPPSLYQKSQEHPQENSQIPSTDPFL